MIIAATGALLLLAPVLVGGRLSRLGGVRFRAGWTVVAAILLQVLVIELLTGPRRLLDAGHIVSYLLAGAFVLANRRIPGLLLIGAGCASNGITITVNGGTLPASAWAMRTAGIAPTSDFVNTGLVAHPRLALLGDVLAIPAPLPFANTFSVGDLLIMVGATYAAFRICGTRWTAAWAPAGRGHGYPRHRADGPGLVRVALPGNVSRTS